MLDFSKLTPDNQAVKDLKELIQLTVFLSEDMAQFMTFMPKVTTGKKLGFIGEMEDVGKAGAGCDPIYQKVAIAAAQKEWKLGSWEVPLEMCYSELENTIAQYCLKTGTEIADLTSTEYMDGIVLPKLQEAMMKMLWRFTWFGDESAASITSGGQITDGLNIELFKTCDGFFKRLFAICATNTDQHTTIAANSEASYALQRAKMKEIGAATSVFDAMLEDADSRIFQKSDHGIFATKSLRDALSRDIKEKYKVIMPWTTIFDGLEVGEYDGVRVIKCSIWDRFIQAYQNNQTKLNLPHRAVLCSPSNLFYGCEGDNPMSELDIWFERKPRKNYIYSTGKLGALIGEDNLVQVAY
ncbi:hypothetical protein [Bacteroides sp.]|uniref:hypothetical protein n=1 Tax=Bacteroides sp. TaxID=29523 RepID=UPI002FCC5563